MPENFGLEQAEQIRPGKQYTNLREFIESTGEETEVGYFCVPTEFLYEVENIRPYNNDHIRTLADSIRIDGQLQPGIGDLSIEDGKIQIRIIAGKHRKKAVELINFEKEPEEPIVLFKINIFNRRLTAREVVGIQMAENLQEKMSPVQDAGVIKSMWEEYKINLNGEGEEANIKEFSARIGRSVDIVKDAIVYIEKIDPQVKKLVEAKVIPYTMALLLADFSKEQGGFGVSDQLRYAQICFAKGLTVDKAKKYLQEQKRKDEKNMALEQQSCFVALDTDEDAAILRDHILTLRYASGLRVRENALWFSKVIRMVKLLNNDKIEAKFSAGVEKVFENLDFSVLGFKKELRPLVSPKDYEFIFGENSELDIDNNKDI